MRSLAAILVLAALALAHRPPERHGSPPPPLTEQQALELPHAELARLVARLYGAPAAAESNDLQKTYWWVYKATDCDRCDVSGSCKGKSIEDCKSLCQKTKDCVGFNYPAGWLKGKDCFERKSPETAVDLYLMSDVPQPAYNAWPPMWPMPKSYSNGTTELLVDAKNWQWSIPESVDLKAAVGRFLPLFFPHPAQPLPSTTSPVLRGLTITVENLDVDLQPGTDESYKILVPATGGKATINAPTVFGAYHALQTLSEMFSFDFETQTYKLPAAPWIIDDKPRFVHRELLVDTSRHFEPVAVIKNVIDGMSYTKINVLHWHLSDSQSFPFVAPSKPELGLMGSYSQTERYSAAELAEVIEYARQRGVRVMMEVDVPGHAGSWCSGDPEVCPSDSCREPLNVAHEHTFDVIKTLLHDLASLAKDEMLHLGGDEVDTTCWENSDEISAWLEKQGMSADQGYEYFVNRAHQIAHAEGRDVVGWEEIWNHFGTRLDKGTIIHQWLSGSKIAANATAHGYRVLWSSSDYWYLDWLQTTWRTMYTAEPCANIPDKQCDTLVLGGGGEMWGETVDASDIMNTVFPRLAAVAERLWSPRDVNNADAAAARYAWFRCLLNSRGIGAAPHSNAQARTAPTGPGGCYDQ